MSEISKIKDSAISNMKALLMVLVVTGHFMSKWPALEGIARVIYVSIYIFHMPAFLFVSGYLSKNVEKGRETAVQKLLLPYCVTVGILALYDLLIKGSTTINLINASGLQWYLLAMFYYKMLLKDLLKLRYVLIFSFGISLISGIFSCFNNTMAIGRTLGFLPFFMMGYLCSKEQFMKLRDIPKWVGILLMAGLVGVIFCAVCIYPIKFPLNILYFKKSYGDMGLSLSKGLIMRGIVLIGGMIGSFFVVNIVSGKRTFLTVIGENSLAVYMLHRVFYAAADHFGLFAGAGLREAVILAGCVIVTVAILSLPIVSRLLNMLLDGVWKLITKPVKNVMTAVPK